MAENFDNLPIIKDFIQKKSWFNFNFQMNWIKTCEIVYCRVNKACVNCLNCNCQKKGWVLNFIETLTMNFHFGALYFLLILISIQSGISLKNESKKTKGVSPPISTYPLLWSNINNFLQLLKTYSENVGDIFIVFPKTAYPSTPSPGLNQSVQRQQYDTLEVLTQKVFSPQKVLHANLENIAFAFQKISKQRQKRATSHLRNPTLPRITFLLFIQPIEVLNLLVDQDKFTLAKDVLIAVTPGSSSRIQISSGTPNLAPRYAIHIGTTPRFEFGGLNLLKKRWTRYSGKNVHQGFESFLKRGKFTSNFDRSYLIVSNYREPKFGSSRRGIVPICANSKLVPWNTFVDTLIICEISLRLNVSIFSLPGYKFPSLVFGSILSSSNRSELYSSGDNLEIGFLVPVHANNALDIKGIFGPIGLQVLLWTVGCTIIVTIFFYGSVTYFATPKLHLPSRLSIYSSFELTYRPMLDQTSERLPYSNHFFRISYVPWLFYCIILTEMYRGELVGYLITGNFDQVPETFGELATSKRSVFVYGNFHPRNNSDPQPKPCEPLSNAYLFLNKEEQFSTKTYSKLLNQLRNCKGGGISPSVQSIFKRLTTSGDVLIDEIFRLQVLQRVVDALSVGYVDLKLSKQLVTSPVFIEIGHDLYYPEVIRLFSNFQSCGLFKMFRDAAGLTRFIEFWQHFKTRNKNKNKISSSEENEVFDNDVGTSSNSQDKGPVILQMSHVKTLLVLYVILCVVSFTVFCWEARKKRKVGVTC